MAVGKSGSFVDRAESALKVAYTLVIHTPNGPSHMAAGALLAAWAARPHGRGMNNQVPDCIGNRASMLAALSALIALEVLRGFPAVTAL